MSSLPNSHFDAIMNGVNGITVEDLEPQRRPRSSSIPQLIARKRDGGSFSETEIDQLIHAVVNKEMQDSQLGALLMAIFLKGMTQEETVRLTFCMMESGDILEWPDDWKPLMVDKHSTGGVGDKVSLPLAPALAACGLKVPMISGRGLGFTGGTLDKLESIPGFSVSLTTTDMKEILKKVGCVIVGQTDKLVPADRIMYAIRDITSTTESIPLIAASIISKKAAESIYGLVLDVKFGNGAVLKAYKDAKELAKTLVYISNGVGIKTTAVLSNMNSPLGKTVGNALEVGEAIQCMQGRGPKSLREVVAALGGQLLYSVGRVKSPEEGRNAVLEVLDNGKALDKFHDMIIAQGTCHSLARTLCSKTSDPFLYLPKAALQTTLKCQKTGYVNGIDALECANVCSYLGAGRTKAGQNIDLTVGLQIHCSVADKITEGDEWITVHHNSHLDEDILQQLQDSLHIKSDPPTLEETELIKEVITG